MGISISISSCVPNVFRHHPNAITFQGMWRSSFSKNAKAMTLGSLLVPLYPWTNRSCTRTAVKLSVQPRSQPLPLAKQSTPTSKNPRVHFPLRPNGQVGTCTASRMRCLPTRERFSGQFHSPHRATCSSASKLTTSASRSFNVHGVLYVGDDEQIAPVEQEIRDLSGGLQMVKDEQAYLVVRERVHRNSESSRAFCEDLAKEGDQGISPWRRVTMEDIMFPALKISSKRGSYPAAEMAGEETLA